MHVKIPHWSLMCSGTNPSLAVIAVLQGAPRGALARAVSPAVSASTELPATTSAEPAPARRAGQEPFVKEVLLLPLVPSGFMESLFWFLFREQVLQLTALDLSEPLNFIGSRHWNVNSPPNAAEHHAGCQMLGTCFHMVKIRYMLKASALWVFMKTLFKQSPPIWALSKEKLVQPYACLFPVPPWSDFEKNVEVCIIPVELFKNRFTSNLNKSNSILSLSHLVKCWTGFLSYIMVSQSAALSQEVAVVLHHFAGILYKKIQEKQHRDIQTVWKLSVGDWRFFRLWYLNQSHNYFAWKAA